MFAVQEELLMVVVPAMILLMVIPVPSINSAILHFALGLMTSMLCVSLNYPHMAIVLSSQTRMLHA